MSMSQKAVAAKLQQHIYKQTGIKKSISIPTISGYGNCLFRAMSKATTRSQEAHEILRLYVLNHMTDPTVANKLQLLFTSGNSPDQNHMQHVTQMQNSGQWGTEQEIAVAAHLLHCSIVCFSKFCQSQFCLQHFPPHFLDSTPCSTSCKHHTIYLVNSSGTHYESALVMPSAEE